jgi:hypothetical protein
MLMGRLAKSLVTKVVLLTSIFALPHGTWADDVAIHPGAGIGPLKLGVTAEQAADIFGRPPDEIVGGCELMHRWTHREGDTFPPSGSEMFVWMRKGRLLIETPDLVGSILLRGGQSKLAAVPQVGIGSSFEAVATALGAPEREVQSTGFKEVLYEERGVLFQARGDGGVITAVGVFWPRFRDHRVRPFDGIGPISLAQDGRRLAEILGRPHDRRTVGPRQRETLSWELTAPSYRGVICNPTFSVTREANTGRLLEVSTNGVGFTTPKGVQVGDNVEKLAQELGPPSQRDGSPTSGAYQWFDPARRTRIVAVFVGGRIFDLSIERIEVE